MRVLCVDDEELIRETVSQHLVLEGFEVETAVNGTDAIQKLQEGSFDIVLLDIDMPEVSGLDVLRYMKDHGITARPIMLTGSLDLRSLDVSAQSGAFDYLPKPYNYHELMDAIARALAEKK